MWLWCLMIEDQNKYTKYSFSDPWIVFTISPGYRGYTAWSLQEGANAVPKHGLKLHWTVYSSKPISSCHYWSWPQGLYSLFPVVGVQYGSWLKACKRSRDCVHIQMVYHVVWVNVVVWAWYCCSGGMQVILLAWLWYMMMEAQHIGTRHSLGDP